MALQSSGQITLQNIRNEFGGSNPVALSQYYRGGSLVPNIAQNSLIPTSGRIKLSDFYGATFADLTPNAVNWANISMNPVGSSWFPASGFNEYLTNSNQTISSISQNINLGINISSASLAITFGTISNDMQISLDRIVGGNTTTVGTIIQGPAGTPVSGQLGTFNVSNNTDVRFGLSMSASSFTPQEGFLRFTFTATVSVVNLSDSNTVLDTFTVEAVAEAGLFS